MMWRQFIVFFLMSLYALSSSCKDLDLESGIEYFQEYIDIMVDQRQQAAKTAEAAAEAAEAAVAAAEESGEAIESPEVSAPTTVVYSAQELNQALSGFLVDLTPMDYNLLLVHMAEHYYNYPKDREAIDQLAQVLDRRTYHEREEWRQDSWGWSIGDGAITAVFLYQAVRAVRYLSRVGGAKKITERLMDTVFGKAKYTPMAGQNLQVTGPGARRFAHSFNWSSVGPWLTSRITTRIPGGGYTLSAVAGGALGAGHYSLKTFKVRRQELGELLHAIHLLVLAESYYLMCDIANIKSDQVVFASGLQQMKDSVAEINGIMQLDSRFHYDMKSAKVLDAETQSPFKNIEITSAEVDSCVLEQDTIIRPQSLIDELQELIAKHEPKEEAKPLVGADDAAFPSGAAGESITVIPDDPY